MKINKTYILLLFIILIAVCLAGCNEARKLSFADETYTVLPGNTITPEINITPKKCEYELISSNPTIAKIDGKNIIGLKEGIVEIIIKSGDITDTAKLIVISDEEYVSNLPIILPEYKRISFIVDDYIYCAPMEIQVGMSPGNPNPIYRGGYTLNGWYTDDNYETLYDFSQPLYEDTAVYGYWTMEEAKYTFETIEGKTFLSGLFYSKVPYITLELPKTAIDNSVVNGIKEGAFKDNITIKEISIPNTYTEIRNEAFSGCTNLETINFEEESTLEKIGIAAFHSCSNLENFVLPSTVSAIESFAFYDCINLDIDSLAPGITQLNQYVFSNTAINSLDLVNVTKILEGAFDKCSHLTSITNTQNIIQCRKYAFRNTSLYNESINDSGIAYIDTILVGASSYLTTFTLDEDITLIADRALYSSSFSNLSIKIHNNPNLIHIGTEAINDTITIIFDDTFFDVCKCPESPWYGYRNQVCTEFQENDCLIYRCYETLTTYRYELKKYFGSDTHFDMTSFNYHFSKIKEGAFHSSDEYTCNLKTLTVGNVDFIEEYAFTNCDNLLAIIFEGESVPALEGNMSIAKNSIANGCVKFYVPSNLYIYYREDWTSFHDQLYKSSIIENGLAINNGFVIQYFGDENTIIIPNEKNDIPVETICENAFRYNASVENIILGENIKTIENSSFTHIENIKTFEFMSTNPPEIGSYFLYRSTNLEKIFVPSNAIDTYKNILPSYSDIIETKE